MTSVKVMEIAVWISTTYVDPSVVHVVMPVVDMPMVVGAMNGVSITVTVVVTSMMSVDLVMATAVDSEELVVGVMTSVKIMKIVAWIIIIYVMK